MPAVVRYGLPLKVIEILVAHFCAFATEERTLPLAPRQMLTVDSSKKGGDTYADVCCKLGVATSLLFVSVKQQFL